MAEVAVVTRRPLVAANWKMHYTHLEAIGVIQKLSVSLRARDLDAVEVSVHPPFTALRSSQTVIDADDLDLALGAQDVHWEDSGPWTGEVSAPMLAKLNVRYVIVGHSERRAHFAETDEIVNKKLRAALRAGMTPICCVGETLDQRDAGATHEVVVAQLRAALAGVDGARVGDLVVAYEPVWAIGTGRTPSGEDAEDVCAVLRSAVADDFGSAAAEGVRVLYGGSVSAVNAAGLLAGADVDGALVGGASLDPVELAGIVAAAHPGTGR
jgi:triosephosphate isomerase